MEDHDDIARRLLGGAQKGGRRAKWRKLDPSSVTHDRLDEGILDGLRETAPRFEPMFEAPDISSAPPTDEHGTVAGDGELPEPKPYEPWEDLASDTFYVFHTYDHPGLKPEDEVKVSRRLHRRIMEKIINSEGFASARRSTRLDSVSAALAAMSVAARVKELLTDELEEAAKQAQQAAEAEQRHQDAVDANDDIRQQVADQGGQLTDDQRQQMRANAQARAQAAADLNDAAQVPPMNAAAAQAIASATKDAGEKLNAIGSFPGSGTGALQDVSPDEALQLAERIQKSKDIQEVLKRFGRFERDMRYQRTNRIIGAPEEIVDIEVGGDLDRVVPSELVKLCHPLLKLDFLRRLHERSLLQYEMIGVDDAGRGPIVAIEDVSLSMNGEKNWWARGAVLAMLSLAHRERRNFYALEFDTQVKAEYEFLGRKPLSPSQIIDFAARRSHGGGTDITSGLRRATEIILTSAAFKTADLVILTDGQDRIENVDFELRDQLHGAGVRLHGVQIGGAISDWLNKVCDDQISVYDMTDPSEATAHIAQALT